MQRNYNNNNRQYSNRSDNYQGYRNEGNYGGNRNNGNNQQQVKKSGATYSKIKRGKFEGLTAVNAWRKTRYGLVTASAFPVDGVVHVGQDKGHEFMRYVVEVKNASLGTSQTYWCLMRKDTKMIVIKELGLVISPNGNGYTASGKRVSGYFGKNFRS